jgi:hypothetical protein
MTALTALIDGKEIKIVSASEAKRLLKAARAKVKK